MSENERRRRTLTHQEELSFDEVKTTSTTKVPPIKPNSQQMSNQPSRHSSKEKRGKSKTVIFLLIVIILILIFIASCSVKLILMNKEESTPVPTPTLLITATPTPMPTQTEGSEFENVLIQKGALVEKKFEGFSNFRGRPIAGDDFASSLFEIKKAVLTDITTGEKYRALKIQGVLYDKYSCNGTLDVYEIDDVIETLEYIKNHPTRNYSEICYITSSGLTIGSAKIESKNWLETLFIKFTNNFENNIVYIDINEIDNLISNFKNAKQSLLAM